jgi:hypothetical protein
MMAKHAAGHLIVAVLGICLTGCREEAHVGSRGTGPQRELMQAFLKAHDKGDLQAEEALVDWDGVTPAFKAHFIEHQLQDGLRDPILAVDIADLPDVGAENFQGYNITPEKFLLVQYGGTRSDKANLYPIGQKDGRYYLVLQTGI